MKSNTNAQKTYTFKESTRKSCLRVPIHHRKEFVPIYPEVLKSLNPNKLKFGIWIAGSEEILEYINAGFDGEDVKKRILELLKIIPKLQKVAKLMVRRDDQQKMYDHIAQARLSKMDGLELSEDEKKISGSYLQLCESSSKIMAFVDQESVEAAEQISVQVVSQVSNFEPVSEFLLKIIEHNNENFDHISFSTLMALSMGKKLGLSATDLKLLSLGCLFMDVGLTELEIPGLYTEKLSPEMTALYERHPALGVDVMNEATAEGVELPEEIFIIIHQHHEKFNGQGFPNQLKGRLSKDNPDGIHPFASIVGLAGKFATYFKQLEKKKVFKPVPAIRAINRMKGEFDPLILKIFNELVDYNPVQQVNVGEKVKWISDD